MSTKVQAAKPEKKQMHQQNPGAAGLIYLLGMIGAFVFYLQQANTFADGAVGFIKAIFWPAFLVYKLLS